MAKELDVFARTIYGEARGEDVAGKVAVANVILNRFKIAKERRSIKGPRNFSDNFGDGITVAGTCQRAWQFSCWNENDPNRDKIVNVKGSDLYFIECMLVAKAALAGLFVDNTLGSTHYYVTTTGFPGGWKKKGEDEPEPAVIIGKHSFHNNIK